MPKIITITAWSPGETGVGGFGGFEVEMGGLIADGLTLGEMLEQVLGIFQPSLRSYPMKTAEEIASRRVEHIADLHCPCDDWSTTLTFYVPL